MEAGFFLLPYTSSVRQGCFFFRTQPPTYHLFWSETPRGGAFLTKGVGKGEGFTCHHDNFHSPSVRVGGGVSGAETANHQHQLPYNARVVMNIFFGFQSIFGGGGGGCERAFGFSLSLS